MADIGRVMESNIDRVSALELQKHKYIIHKIIIGVREYYKSEKYMFDKCKGSKIIVTQKMFEQMNKAGIIDVV